MSKRFCQQSVDVPVPQIPVQIVEVILGGCGSLAKATALFYESVWKGAVGSTGRACCPTVSPTPECWRILTACGEGAVGGTFHTCCPTAHSHTRMSVDSECKRWNLEHVVLDLFSHFTLGKVQWLSHVVLDPFSHIQTGVIRWLFDIRPVASCEPHSCRYSQASSQRPHLAARPPPCAA